MFGDKTPSSIVWWPNMLMLKWVAKRLKHVWSNTDQTIETSRWASVARIPASNKFDTRLSKRTREQKQCFKFLIECLMAFHTTKHDQTQPTTTNHDQTQSNTIKQHQTRCPNAKMFGHQTMFDGVWSPNISRLSRALSSCFQWFFSSWNRCRRVHHRRG